MGRRVWWRKGVILLGALAALIVLVGVVLVPSPVPVVMRERSAAVLEARTASVILYTYASDHDGNYPDTLEVLVDQNYWSVKAYRETMAKYPGLAYTKPRHDAPDDAVVITIPMDGGSAVAFKATNATFERIDSSGVQSARSAQ